jgi:hypothetical protein
MRRLLTIVFFLLMPFQLVYAGGTFTWEELKLILNQKPSLANYLFSTLDFDEGGYTDNRIGSNVNKALAGKAPWSISNSRCPQRREQRLYT